MLKTLLDDILITIFTFLLLSGIASIPLNLDALNPIEKIFDDFDMTDIVFSQIRDVPPADDNIVMVNIGGIDREGLAAMISILNQYNPRIIAIDAFYRKPKEGQGDSLLAQALAEVKNLVLVSEFAKYNEKKKQFDTLETSNPMFLSKAHLGFANLITGGEDNMREFLTCRTFSPKEKVLGKTEYAFAVKIAQLYKPEAAKKILARNKGYEIINYRGNLGIDDGGSTVFAALDIDQVLEEKFEPTAVRNKILILGYMGESLNERSFNDKFYTPLNKNYVGKGTPDMFGVVVHANIVSMILRGEYINEMNEWLNKALAIFASFLSIVLFSYFFRKAGFWYDTVTILFQLLITLLLFAVTIYAFHWYKLKVNITVALFAVIISGIFVEIYYGVVRKLLTGLSKRVIQSKVIKT